MRKVIVDVTQEPLQGLLRHGLATSLLWMKDFTLRGEESALDQCLPVRPIR